MQLQRILKNRNWERVFTLLDEDGIPYYDPTEREEPENVHKYVTMDGETYEFIRVQHHPWHRRIWFDISSYFGVRK